MTASREEKEVSGRQGGDGRTVTRFEKRSPNLNASMRPIDECVCRAWSDLSGETLRRMDGAG